MFWSFYWFYDATGSIVICGDAGKNPRRLVCIIGLQICGCKRELGKTSIRDSTEKRCGNSIKNYGVTISWKHLPNHNLPRYHKTCKSSITSTYNDRTSFLVLPPTSPLQTRSPPRMAAPKTEPAFFSIKIVPDIIFSPQGPTYPAFNMNIGSIYNTTTKVPKASFSDFDF